jgi:AbrB family looped-hinge helix DNA binding protein
MAKVTSKLQVTIPKELADAYRIRPGSEIRWVAAGEAIRLEPMNRDPSPAVLPVEKRVRLFEEAMRRVEERRRRTRGPISARGWKREDLYQRGRPR